jgi:hypothetical protein
MRQVLQPYAAKLLQGRPFRLLLAWHFRSGVRLGRGIVDCDVGGKRGRKFLTKLLDTIFFTPTHR